MPEVNDDTLENGKVVADGINSSPTSQQKQQNIFELDETRKIMIKRRKPMPLVEEFNFDEIFSED